MGDVFIELHVRVLLCILLILDISFESKPLDSKSLAKELFSFQIILIDKN